MRKSTVLSFVVATCALTGCELTTADKLSSLSLEIDKPAYTAVHISGSGKTAIYGFTMIAKTYNHGSATVFLDRCLPAAHPAVDLAMADGKESAFGGGCSEAGHDQQFPLAAGAVRVDTVLVTGPHVFDHYTQEHYGSLSGAMRAQVGSRGCAGFNCPPGDNASSPQFTVSLDSSTK